MEKQLQSDDMNQAVATRCGQSSPFALATVLHAEGSTPRKAGVKALIDAQGRIQGTIGGGQVEAEAQHRAVRALANGSPEVFDFHLHGAVFASGEPVCGGLMRVLIDPHPFQHRAAFQAASAALRLNRRGVLLTGFRARTKPAIQVDYLAEEAIASEMGFPGTAAIRSALAQEQPIRFLNGSPTSEETVEVLVEPILPKPRLLIAGGGHVGRAVALLADQAGFQVLVLDERPEFTRADAFPEGIATRCGRLAEELATVPVDTNTYVVIVTPGHRQDGEALAACIRRPAGYVGMIGSRRKIAVLRKEFIESGQATAAEFDRVHAPIGLEIDAVTVPEIAISIVAQLIAVRRRGRRALAPTPPTA